MACPLCGEVAGRTEVIGFDRLAPREGSFPYRRCAGCDLLFRAPLPAPEEIRSLYPPEYGPHQDRRRPGRDGVWNRIAKRHLYGADRSRASPFLAALLRPMRARILPGLLLPHGICRLLDVGCGSGALLERHRELGWTVRGIEPSLAGIAACRARGLEVHHGSLRDAPWEPGSFDVVILNHVVEHLLEPRAALVRAAELLAPGGYVRVVTPNSRAWGYSLYRSCWYHLDAPRHLMLFSPRTIERLASQSGLRMRRRRTVPAARTLADSRHFARTQGPVLPDLLDERREVIERSARGKSSHRIWRSLVQLPGRLAALTSRGEVLEVELENPPR